MMKLFRYLRPYRLFVASVILFIFLQTLADLFLPTLMADIVDQGIVQGDTALILKIGAWMLLIAAGGALCSVAGSYFAARSSAGFGRDVRERVFAHVQHFSLQEFDRIGTASLITRTTNDITQVQQVLAMMLRMMIMAPLMCVGGIIMAVSKDAKLSLILVVVIPILAAAIIVIAIKGMPLFKVMQIKIDKINLVLREGLTGIRVIRAFNRMNHEQQRFDDANLDLTNTAIRVNRLMGTMMPLMMLIMNFSTIAIIWFGGIRIDAGDLQVGNLMAFIQYAMQILFSLMMVSMMFVMIPRAQASAIRINEVLEMQATITDSERQLKANETPGRIEFDRVTFRYPGAEIPALSEVSFTAEPGEMTAIIGGTGSGKSTLIHLIPRFYDVQQGSIRIGGVDVREMSQQSLRAHIGFVSQKSLLFTGSIMDNIRFGHENATDEEVFRAAEVAQAAEFVNEMPDGYQSEIAQGGTNVSGGQKQRLSIARALVRKPEIYLFDDSFSALDFKTDAKLREALQSEVANSAMLVVAQRVSTVMNADKIIVLDEGRVAGIGTHRELLDSCGVYREIVSSQLSEEEIA